MDGFKDTQISAAIVGEYYKKLTGSLQSDVLIVGGGPSGLVAAEKLAQRGLKVTIIEKRLSPGGGIWGGGIGMNEIVVQDYAVAILDEFGVRHKPGENALHTADAVELACGLCLKAIQAGAVMLNLMTVEDVCIRDGEVTGVVVNRSMISGALPVDPIMFSAGAVIDATGHEAVIVEAVRRRGLLKGTDADGRLEGPMDAAAGEAFVVERAGEVYPRLWVTGMSVCATFGGPRMGPIFGGMLLSGKRVAEMVANSLK